MTASYSGIIHSAVADARGLGGGARDVRMEALFVATAVISGSFMSFGLCDPTRSGITR